jgi:hypothetical protein
MTHRAASELANQARDILEALATRGVTDVISVTIYDGLSVLVAWEDYERLAAGQMQMRSYVLGQEHGKVSFAAGVHNAAGFWLTACRPYDMDAGRDDGPDMDAIEETDFTYLVEAAEKRRIERLAEVRASIDKRGLPPSWAQDDGAIEEMLVVLQDDPS